jgi:HlyD family secretion protein
MKNQFSFYSRCTIPCLMGVLLALSCNNNNQEADAYGNFEADEVIVSAQSQGNLLFLEVQEGDAVEKDRMIGKIDTSVPALKRNQLLAQNRVILARMLNLDAQLKVQEEQRVNLTREVSRMEKLLRDNAATQQQYDDIAGQLNVLVTQTKALESQQHILAGEQLVLNAQLEEVRDLLKKCEIVSPLSGTLLERYAEQGELVTPGKALLKIAQLGTMELKVYISGAQLASVAIGDSVKVFIDRADDGIQPLDGVVSWISSQVEFTPKIIQTREERVNMVYAVKVRVGNDGRLKIGMPGEVVFREKEKSVPKASLREKVKREK